MSAITPEDCQHIFMPPTEHVDNAPQKESSIVSLVQRVIELKENHVNKAKNNTLDRYNPILIGGDLFTMAYLIFQGVQTYAHISLPLLGLASLVCGVVAGVICVGVAFISLKESIQAFYNGDTKLGLRLLLDFIGMLGIGGIMILVPLATKFAALSCVTAFFAANPWVLPVLFFAITIPLLIEISCRVKNIYLKKDLATDLKLDELSKLLKNDIVNWSQISFLYENKNPFHPKIEGAKDLIERMEKFQSEMGVTVALEAFKLFESILKGKKEDAISHYEDLQRKISEWNAKQHVRLLQQILFVIAFVLSMVALRVHLPPTIVNSVENFLMAGANAIPLYMDTFWPFERNTTLVVPKVEQKELEAWFICTGESNLPSAFNRTF
jgi:hypothetical protein